MRLVSSVIVSVDDTSRRADATALASTLARHLGSTVLAVSMYRPSDPTSFSDEYADAMAAVEWTAQSLAPTFLAGERRLRAEDPVDALCELACETQAELIVIGAIRDRGSGRLGVAPVGLRLVHAAPCAVAVAPAGWARTPTALQRIGVVCAGPSDGALPFGLRLAEAARAALRVHRPCDDVSRDVDDVDLLVLDDGTLPAAVMQRLVESARCPIVVLRRTRTAKRALSR
jgi:nucleotide-binding universal stress UspA family protein